MHIHTITYNYIEPNYDAALCLNWSSFQHYNAVIYSYNTKTWLTDFFTLLVVYGKYCTISEVVSNSQNMKLSESKIKILYY